jgi:hypothetical protein
MSPCSVSSHETEHLAPVQRTDDLNWPLLSPDDNSNKEPERRKYWKTADVGYFWPDMPASYGPGRIVDYDGSGYFRDVNSFVSQLRDTMRDYSAEVVANNVQNCLKGQAFTWYSDILPAQTKRLLRLDTASDCKEWTDTLLDAFPLSGAEAMKKISSDSTRDTMQMLKNGVSLVNWFTDMVSLATDADFGKVKQILRFIWYKMDAEMRDRTPRLLESHSVQSYLTELRNAEESMRESVVSQDRRLANELATPYWRSGQGARGQFGRNWQPRTYQPTEPPVFRPASASPQTTESQASPRTF